MKVDQVSDGDTGALARVAFNEALKAEAFNLPVIQATHGFVVKDALYFNGTVYVKAKADAPSTLGLFVVTEVSDVNNFVATTAGKFTTTGLTAGQYYYVSEATAGLLTATEPAVGNYSNPLVFAVSTTEGVVVPIRPSLVSSGSPEDQANKSTVNGYVEFISNNAILFNQQNTGIKVNPSSPAFPWDDLRGQRSLPTSGGSAASREEWKTDVYSLGYNINDFQDWEMHTEHREVIGGDKFLHPHLRHNGTSITGNLVIDFVVAHNFGHNRVSSPAPVSFTLTIPDTIWTQHDTYIPDMLFMQSGGGALAIQNLTGGTTVSAFTALDSDDILPDDDFLITATISTMPTISGGLSAKIFNPFIDIHRQVVDGSGTLNKDSSGGSFYV